MNNNIKKKLPIIFSIVGAVAVVTAICIFVIINYNKEADYKTDENNTTGSTSENIQTTEPTEPEDGYGKIIINGEQDIDAVLFAKRAYELRFLFAVNSFEKPEDISLNQIVQYSFCHLYNESLTDMLNNPRPVYKEASVDEIKSQINSLFNISDLNILKSDLYNEAENRFEMWQPNNRSEVFAKVQTEKKSDGVYELDIEYFTDYSMTLPKGKLSLTVENNKISKMVS